MSLVLCCAVSCCAVLCACVSAQVMGLSGLMTDWYPLPQLLAVDGDEHRVPVRPVIVLDNRGMGRSLFPPDWEEDLTMDVMAADVLDVLHHLRITKCSLLGWSMGGYIVQHVLAVALTPLGGKEVPLPLAAEGVVIHKVVLTATMPRAVGTDMDPAALAKRVRATKDKEAARRLAAEYLLELQYAPTWLADPANRPVLAARIADGLAGGRPQHVITAQLNAILTGEDMGAAVLRRVPRSLPVAVIHGDSDRMVHPVGGELLRAALPHAERLTHPDIHLDFGHFWFDHPHTESWARIVAAFLHDDGPGNNSSTGAKARL